MIYVIRASYIISFSGTWSVNPESYEKRNEQH